MNWSNLIAGGAIGGMALGVAASFWTKIKAVLWWFASLVVVQVIITDESTQKAILAYLIQTFRRSRIYDRCYGANSEYTRDGRYGLIPFEFLGGKSVIFWNGWRPLAYGYNKPTGGTTFFTAGNSGVAMTYVRGTYDVEGIVTKACAARNHLTWNVAKDRKTRRFFIKEIPSPKDSPTQSKFSVGSGINWFHEGAYRLLSHDPGELGRVQTGKISAMDLLIFPDRIKRLIKEIQIWRSNRNWYLERGLPWKRGWILYGPPGTGKSALVRAFAEDEDMPLFVFSLGEMLNSDLQKSWEEMQAYVPCIALFEDIDNVFHGRHNVTGRGGMELALLANSKANKPSKKEAGDGKAEADTKDDAQIVPMKGMLSFDCLLNCIDGARKSEGVFTVITTNDITKIDPAVGVPTESPDGEINFISTRPGRIDKAIELGHMENADKVQMARRILDGYPEGFEHIMEFIRRHPTFKETPAQFQERCAQMALSYFWKAKEQAEGVFREAEFEGDLTRKLLTVQGAK